MRRAQSAGAGGSPAPIGVTTLSTGVSKCDQRTQSNLNDEYRMSLCQRWRASILRIVPDFDRITNDCVPAPSPQ